MGGHPIFLRVRYVVSAMVIRYPPKHSGTDTGHPGRCCSSLGRELWGAKGQEEGGERGHMHQEGA